MVGNGVLTVSKKIISEYLNKNYLPSQKIIITTFSVTFGDFISLASQEAISKFGKKRLILIHFNIAFRGTRFTAGTDL